MKKTYLPVAAVFILLLVGHGSFVLGKKIQYDQTSVQWGDAQTLLSINQFNQYRKIEEVLSKGCTSEALEMLKSSMDDELKVISQFNKQAENSWLNKHTPARDPEFLSQLNGFKSQDGNAWNAPECKK